MMSSDVLIDDNSEFLFRKSNNMLC